MELELYVSMSETERNKELDEEVFEVRKSWC